MSLEVCPHSLSTDLSPPRLSNAVHREECTLCFDDQDQPEGVDVCLTCFNGGCPSEERHHARTHWEKSQHPMVVNVRRTKKPQPDRNDEEPPLKKLAILEAKEEDQYDYHLSVRCYACGGIEVEQTPEIKNVVEGIMASNSSAKQSEIKAWEEDITPCEHTLTLQQVEAYEVRSTGATCSKCELGENLWLCLTCGALGCGRAQYGGNGGNGHGLAHFTETNHPLAVKLGTITPEGTADIYCYSCNDAKLDPELSAHLANFKINVMSQMKTEKSMTELQLEHNLKFEFNMKNDDGTELAPVFGPGLTGLKNLGNSCYLASTLQCLFQLPSFQYAYDSANKSHASTCPRPADACVECQMRKIADGLLSGRYSHAADQEDRFQKGIKPTMLKDLIGKGHEEFASMRQQDAEEFLQHLIKTLRADALKTKNISPGSGHEAADVFRFGLEQRLQCTECGGVRYRTDEQDSLSVPVEITPLGTDSDGKTTYKKISVEDSLGALMAPERLEYACPACKKTVQALKQSRFTTFPDVMVIHVKKFQLINWVPQKIDVPFIVGSTLSLDPWTGTGLKAGEVALPEDSDAAPLQPEFNEPALDMLQGMGFPLVRCQKALLATGNSDAEAAMNWLFAHMEDPDIDAPLDLSSGPKSSAVKGPSAEQISMLADMGFSPAQARKALREANGNAEQAIEWLFSNPGDPGEEESIATSESATEGIPSGNINYGGSSELPATYKLKAFISHKGPSVHSGHYVATVEDTESGAVLFNDEKVVRSEGTAHSGLRELAYLYIFTKV